MLSYVLWEVHEYPAPPISVEINHDCYRIFYGWSEHSDSESEWQPMVESQRSSIEAVLEQVEYWKWSRSYTDPDVTDGTTWSIKVRGGKTGRRRKNCYGVNDFPPQWERLHEVLMAIAN